MSYQIIIDALTLPVHIGLHEAEHKVQQSITCHLAITLTSTQAAHSDAIADTLHYGDLCDYLVAFVQKQPYQLLERLAHDVMDAIEAFHGVEHIDIRLLKCNPEVLPHAKGAGVHMQRTCV